MGKKIKWGVIGCGRIAERQTVPGILEAENSELSIIMRTDAEKAAALGKKAECQIYNKHRGSSQ